MRTVRPVAAALALFVAAGCQTDEPAFIEVPPAEELWEQAQQELEGLSILGLYDWIDTEQAIETLQAIIDNYPYSDYAIRAELAIADAYFDNAQYEEALTYYRDFDELHPGHPKVPYTLWRAALCHQRQVLDPGRDQSATRNAIGFLDRLLIEHPRSEYGVEAETMWRELQTTLAESEQAIADFYYSREEYEAAAERYRGLLDAYPGLGLDAAVLYRLGQCYAALRRQDEADRIFRTLVAHYGETDYAWRARDQLATDLP